ncbi:hypothetical protein F9L16_09860 [Agarivorans sp. B2Z047]|uniref:hypothetical protein n=1 Tax=Agarivorans sp. B2Z047 TaxID=2652721 RepID=UPI00128B87A0|nr:hypothetical protein [Agarivorans sp. B2Z047]MPW29304.1 hypothetical protein [Agarivorans sp. B2Z047]UQN41857.1 hypothetical protein LQZ07_19075 [Agarivorans sp. B2Z047]
MNIASIFELSKQKVTLKDVFIISLVVYTAMETTEISEKVETYSTQYAFDVLSYGFKDLGSDAEIKAQVKEWHKNDWGAQIAAIQVICDASPTRLEVLMSKQLSKEVCRLAL